MYSHLGAWAFLPFEFPHYFTINPEAAGAKDPPHIPHTETHGHAHCEQETT